MTAGTLVQCLMHGAELSMRQGSGKAQQAACQGPEAAASQHGPAEMAVQDKCVLSLERRAKKAVGAAADHVRVLSVNKRCSTQRACSADGHHAHHTQRPSKLWSATQSRELPTLAGSQQTRGRQH